MNLTSRALVRYPFPVPALVLTVVVVSDWWAQHTGVASALAGLGKAVQILFI
jgi:hypothetical protein